MRQRAYVVEDYEREQEPEHGTEDTGELCHVSSLRPWEGVFNRMSSSSFLLSEAGVEQLGERPAAPVLREPRVERERDVGVGVASRLGNLGRCAAPRKGEGDE